MGCNEIIITVIMGPLLLKLEQWVKSSIIAVMTGVTIQNNDVIIQVTICNKTDIIIEK